MANPLKELLSRPLPRGTSTHATLLSLIGAYLVYLAYEMLRDTLSGASEMSLPVTLILGGIMALVGVAVVIYGLWMWRENVRKEAAPEEPQEDSL